MLARANRRLISAFALVGLMCALPCSPVRAQAKTTASPQAGNASPATPAAVQGGAAPIERRQPAADPDLDLAANLIGQALFLRCFCAADTLTFTAAGQPEVSAKARLVDWTLAGVNVEKVQRRSPAEIELDGVRVAVRFAPDRREWDRHPQKDEKMRLTVQDGGDSASFRRTLAAIFSVGIDRALQRSTPAYWQHFFDPQTPWPADETSGQTLYTPGKPDSSGQSASAPVPVHKVEASYTSAAQHDSVRGTVGLQFVVAPSGAPLRIAIAQPLGYGLDAEAAEALARFHFTPGQWNGTPVATQVRINQEFVLVARPQ